MKYLEKIIKEKNIKSNNPHPKKNKERKGKKEMKNQTKVVMMKYINQLQRKNPKKKIKKVVQILKHKKWIYGLYK